MATERNVGRVDRALRAVAGTVLLGIAVDAVIDERRLLAAFSAIAGLALLRNALTGYCALNETLGIDTCGSEYGDESAGR